MVDLDVFDRRLARLEELLRRLRGLDAVQREVFLVDVAIQAQAERWLHLAAECTIDIAHHLIADRGWRTPATYREAFDVLRDEGVLSDEQTVRMQRWAALRNVLVHLYLEVDHAILFEILSRDLSELEQYAAAVARSVSNEPDEG